MLEHATLRLLPWAWTTPALLPALDVAAWVREIQAPDTGLALGSVRAVRGPLWLGFGPRRLDVCETEDAALLMTVAHGWFGFGHWQVIDAEQSRVGAVVGAHLLDEQNFRFATLWPEDDARRTIRAVAGAVYARLGMAADGATQLRFADDLDANPFLRMVLLAACVLQAPTPPQHP